MTIKLRTSVNSYKLIRANDKHFTFSPDGFTLVPRAGIEITDTCPKEYQYMIQQAYRKGWLRSVAAMTGPEYLMEVLKA